MKNQKNEQVKFNINEVKNKLLILADSSVFIPLYHKRHPHYSDAWAVVNLVLSYKATYKDKIVWVFPEIVCCEFFDYYKQRHSLNETLDILVKFMNKLGKPFITGGPSLDMKTIIELYWGHRKKRKIRKIGVKDFLILVGGQQLNAKILTCDKNMYEVGKRSLHADIYFVSTQSSKQKCQLDKFIKSVQNKLSTFKRP